MEKVSLMERLKHNSKQLAATASLGMVGMTLVPAAAADDKMDQIVGGLIYYVLKIFRYIGIFFVAWGLVQMFLAFKNEDADSKSRAIMVLLSGVLLATIESIAKVIIKNIDPSLHNKISQLT